MKVSIFFSAIDRTLTVLHELFMKPTLPLWSESFYRDTSTPLRHDHDIPEGRPRTVKLFHLLLSLLSCFLAQPHTSVWSLVFLCTSALSVKWTVCLFFYIFEQLKASMHPGLMSLSSHYYCSAMHATMLCIFQETVLFAIYRSVPQMYCPLH